MTLKFGAGAFAAATLCIAAFMGGSGSAVRAESEQIVPPAPVVEELPADAPRFVSHEVVQPLPEEPAAPDDAASLQELVSAMSTKTELSRDVRCLAEAIYFEARGEPLAGQLAVAQVIVNRSESNLFPESYCDVVTQRGQFSFVKGGRIPAVREDSTAWRRAHAIAQIAHRDLWESEAGDALFFHATYVRPSWASRKIARATIDRHVFYR